MSADYLSLPVHTMDPERITSTAVNTLRTLNQSHTPKS